MFTRSGFAFFLVLISVGVSAQPDSTAGKWRGFASLHAGALFAHVGAPTASLAFMSGVRADRISLSAGVGYDGYQVWETLPVFAGVGWDIARIHNTAFYLQVNGGYARAWHNSREESSTVIAVDGGYFAQPVIGYRLSQGRLEVYVSVGYKFQRIEYEHSGWGWNWGMQNRIRVAQDMERLSIQLGVGFR